MFSFKFKFRNIAGQIFSLFVGFKVFFFNSLYFRGVKKNNFLVAY